MNSIITKRKEMINTIIRHIIDAKKVGIDLSDATLIDEVQIDSMASRRTCREYIKIARLMLKKHSIKQIEQMQHEAQRGRKD